MLNMLLSKPSAGISLAATPAIAWRGPAGRRLGYSKRRKLIPLGCMTASVTPIAVIRPPCIQPSNVTSLPSSSSSAIRVRNGRPSSARSAAVTASISSLRMGDHRCELGLIADPVGELRQVRCDRLEEERERQRRDRIGIVQLDRRERRRHLRHGLGLDAAAGELVVAAHERRAAGAGQPGVVRQNRRQMPGRIARSEDPIGRRAKPGHVVDERARVEARPDRLSGKAKPEPAENPLIGQVQPVALAGADHQCGGHGAATVRPPAGL